MARFTKNHMLEIGALVLAVGLVLSLASYIYRFAKAPSWMGWYESILASLPGAEPVGYNLWAMIIGTIMLVMGAFYFGEQLVLRRRFERLIDTPKKSEFVSNRPKLDELARRLPDGYKQRVRTKESEFRSTR